MRKMKPIEAPKNRKMTQEQHALIVLLERLGTVRKVAEITNISERTLHRLKLGSRGQASTRALLNRCVNAVKSENDND